MILFNGHGVMIEKISYIERNKQRSSLYYRKFGLFRYYNKEINSRERKRCRGYFIKKYGMENV
jgi:hypothetical protein